MSNRPTGTGGKQADAVYNNDMPYMTLRVSILLALFCAPALYAAPVVDKPQLRAAAARAEKPVRRDWTVMAYFNGKNDLSNDLIDSLNELERAGSSRRVNVVAELGLAPGSKAGWKGVRRFYVTKDADVSRINSDQLSRLSSADMGSPKHLENFVAWTKKNYPADRYLLLVLTHGAGAAGLSPDSASGNSISVAGFARALEKTGGVDVLLLQSCYMQTAELAGELRGLAGAVVASQERSYTGAHDLKKIVNILRHTPGMDGKAAARKTLDNFLAPSNTNSLLLPEKTAALEAALSAWVDAATAAAEKDALAQAALDVRRFGKPEQCDLAHFIQLANAKTLSPQAKQAGEAALAALAEAVPQNKVNYGKNVNGLSIYMPPGGAMAESYAGSAFAKRSGWLKLINWMNAHNAFNP